MSPDGGGLSNKDAVKKAMERTNWRHGQNPK